MQMKLKIIRIENKGKDRRAERYKEHSYRNKTFEVKNLKRDKKLNLIQKF